MNLVEVMESTKNQLVAMTGLKPVAVTRAMKFEHGWRVSVELLELSRIPASTDVLADYDVLLGDDGTILSFERTRTRLRAEPTEAAQPV